MMCFRVGEEGQLEMVLLAETDVALGRIRTHSQHRYIQLLKGRERICEIAGLGRAPRGIVLGVAIQDHPPALVIPQADRFLFLIRKAEIRRLDSNLHTSTYHLVFLCLICCFEPVHRINLTWSVESVRTSSP